MKLNWKVRLQNKVTLSAIILAIIALGYQITSMLNITPAISESQVIEAAGMLINLLVLVGVVVDPTTKGVSDSQQALAYTEPK